MHPLSPVERLWLVAEALHPPFAIHWVVLGPPPAGLEQAVQRAAEANPGVACSLAGRLHRAHWVAGAFPIVRVAERAFLPGALPTDPLLGVDVTAYANATVFRGRHALIDGRGLVHFAQEVYRSLRGEALRGSVDGPTDLQLANARTDRTRSYPPEVAVAATGEHSGDPTSVWARLSVPGPQHQLNGKLLAAMTCAALEHHPDGPVCLHVPVDLRRPGEESTGNRTGLVFLEGQTDSARMQQALTEAFPEAPQWVRAQAVVRFVPLWLLRWFGARGVRRSLASSRFGATAVVSNLGRVDLLAFSTPDAPAESVLFVPPGGPATAAFLGAVGTERGVEITVVAPRGLADGGRLDALMRRIEEHLTRS